MFREKMDLEWLVLYCLFYTILENTEIGTILFSHSKNRFKGVIQK